MTFITHSFSKLILSGLISFSLITSVRAAPSLGNAYIADSIPSMAEKFVEGSEQEHIRQ
ncbi:MAG: hypothetical protein AAF327_19565 [Cyanobacteria bacterium P01_A01_bin.37]